MEDIVARLWRKLQFGMVYPSQRDNIIAQPENGNAPRHRNAQLARRKLVEFDADFRCHIGAPEDIILSKLLYYQEGQSPKHLRDIAGMLKVSPGQIDQLYIANWAGKLGVLDIWQSILVRLAIDR